MSEALIELGEFRDDPVGSDPVAPRHYRAVFGAVAVLLSMVLGGAVPVRPTTPPVIVRAEITDRFQIRADRLYVIELGDAIDPVRRRQTIRAYSLPDVRPLFEHEIDVDGEILDVRPVRDGLLLLDTRSYTSSQLSTIAIRPGVAEPLWKRTGAVVGVAPGGGTVVFGSTTYGGDVPEVPIDWFGADIETGATRWRVRKAAGELAVADDGRLFLLRAGRLIAYDTADGRVAAEAALPGLEASTSVLWTLGKRLLVSGETTGTTVFGDAAGLAAPVHLAGSLTGYQVGSACGDLICAYTGNGELVGLDPATLAKRWSVPSGFAVWENGSLLTYQPEGTPYFERSDPVTGEVTGRVDGWEFAPGAGPEFYVRRKESGGRVWFGVLDEDRFVVRPLAVTGGVTDECQVAGEVLICRKIDANIEVSRLR